MDSGLVLRTPRNDEGKNPSTINKSCPSRKSLRFSGSASSKKFAEIENISVYQNIKPVLYHSHPVPLKGASAIVTNEGRGAMDAEVPLTKGMEAYGKDVWS